VSIFISAVVFCVTVAMKTSVLATQDLYLHIATGRWILAHGAIPDHDIFSAGGMTGTPWVAHEWLTAVGYALLYDHLGWGGVLAATALALAVAVGALALNTADRLGPLGALVAALLAWGLCIYHLTARPHVIVLPLVVIWLVAHVDARRDNRTPSLYLIPVMTLWANLHGSYLFGLAFTALFAAEALFEAETIQRARTVILQWGVFLIAAVVAAIATPHGLRGLLFPFQLVYATSGLDALYEWEPSSLTNNAPLIMWCFLLLFVALLHGVRLPICRLIMFLLLLYMAFAHRRHTVLLGLAAPLLLQDAIGDMLRRSAPSWITNWRALAAPAIRLSMTGAALLAMGIAAFAGCRNLAERSDKFTPAAALNAVATSGITGPVLNGRIFGGYLIFRGYSPFVDGRIDMFSNEFTARFAALDQLPGLLKQYRIAWTIFEPDNPRLVLMDILPGWSRVYADEKAVIHIRSAVPSR
jgi:hypothetical protein